MPKPEPIVEIRPFAGWVKVFACGALVAETSAALELIENNYRPVYYVPRDDVRMALFEKTTTRTHCPHKGDAAYFSISVSGRRADNAAWSYEKPFDGVAEIAGKLAFDPSNVDRIEII